MEQFLLHYMEESFMPWLWIIQDIFTKNYVQKETKENAIEMKLFNNGISMIEKMNLVCDLSNDIKEIILEDVEYFISNKLKTYIIQPYWDINNNCDSNIKIVCVRFYKHGTKIIDKSKAAKGGIPKLKDSSLVAMLRNFEIDQASASPATTMHRGSVAPIVTPQKGGCCVVS